MRRVRGPTLHITRITMLWAQDDTGGSLYLGSAFRRVRAVRTRAVSDARPVCFAARPGRGPAVFGVSSARRRGCSCSSLLRSLSHVASWSAPARCGLCCSSGCTPSWLSRRVNPFHTQLLKTPYSPSLPPSWPLHKIATSNIAYWMSNQRGRGGGP